MDYTTTNYIFQSAVSFVLENRIIAGVLWIAFMFFILRKIAKRDNDFILKKFSKYPFKLKVVDPYITEDTNIELDIEYSNEINFEESYEAVLLLVAHEKFVNLSIKQWRSLIHNDSLLFDLKGIIPRSLNPMRI